MIIKKKLIFALLFAFVMSILFWQVLDLTTRLTPDLDNHFANLEKYYLKFDIISSGNLELSASIKDYFKIKIDIGYIFLNYLSYILGLNFENFLFIAIFLTYIVYIRTFYRLTSCKKSIMYVLLILFASFWMNSTLGATLRQGIAISFLYYFLFNNNKTSFKKAFFIIILSSLIHMSAIILIPYLIFEKIFIKRLKLLSLFFVIVTTLYILDLNLFMKDIIVYLADAINIETRSLMGNRPDHPSVGFSIGKLLATIIPLILFLLAFCINKNPIQMTERRMYVYYIYASSLGMLLSQMTYYERLLMYAWAFSPFLLTFFCNTIYSSFIISLNKNFKSIK